VKHGEDLVFRVPGTGHEICPPELGRSGAKFPNAADDGGIERSVIGASLFGSVFSVLLQPSAAMLIALPMASLSQRALKLIH
jgi:hypothetical protein